MSGCAALRGGVMEDKMFWFDEAVKYRTALRQIAALCEGGFGMKIEVEWGKTKNYYGVPMTDLKTTSGVRIATILQGSDGRFGTVICGEDGGEYWDFDKAKAAVEKKLGARNGI